MKLDFLDVSKRRHDNGKNEFIVKDLNFQLKSNENLSIMCTDELRRLQVMRLILGTVKPDMGKVVRDGSFSTPIGDTAAFHGEMSVLDNIRFICRLYGKNTTFVTQKVNEYLEGTISLKKRSKLLNAIEKRKVAMALALFLKLDVYLIRGDIGHPEPAFKHKFEEDFLELNKESTLITVSTNLQMIKKIFHTSIVIDQSGFMTAFPDVNDGILRYQEISQLKRA